MPRRQVLGIGYLRWTALGQGIYQLSRKFVVENNRHPRNSVRTDRGIRVLFTGRSILGHFIQAFLQAGRPGEYILDGFLEVLLLGEYI